MARKKKDAFDEHPVLFAESSEAEDHEISVESLLNAQRPDSFDFKMELKLKAGNQTHSVPVAAGHCFGDRIEEIIEKQFNAAYFKERLRAIVGPPMGADREAGSPRDYDDEM